MASSPLNPSISSADAPSLVLEVPLGERSYPIHIGAGLISSAGGLLLPLLPQKRAIVVADATTGELYGDALKTSLKAAGIDAASITLPVGEETKSLGVFSKLLEDILACRPERKTTLIALGGGVIGDITGFAASVILRGIPFVQIPTTLLAQVDSSVGGKTAVNSVHGKNLIGSFYQPLAVLADTDALGTLPARELRAGYAEVLKYGLLGDTHFFHWLEEHGQRVLAGEQDALTKAIETSCRAKAIIVGQDEKESADRALLNLGHTFGHALEKATGYGDALLHGEAVAVGCLMAFDLSVRMGLCERAELERVRLHMEETGLLPDLASLRVDWDAQELAHWCYQDKKVEGGKLTFVLARGIGKAFVCRDVREQDVAEVFASYV